MSVNKVGRLDLGNRIVTGSEIFEVVFSLVIGKRCSNKTSVLVGQLNLHIRNSVFARLQNTIIVSIVKYSAPQACRQVFTKIVVNTMLTSTQYDIGEPIIGYRANFETSD